MSEQSAHAVILWERMRRGRKKSIVPQPRNLENYIPISTFEDISSSNESIHGLEGIQVTTVPVDASGPWAVGATATSTPAAH
jgi:hypothetical protein